MQKKRFRSLSLLGERAFALFVWLAVWQLAAAVIGQKILLVTPVEAVRCLLAMLPQPSFWGRVAFSGARILAGFGLAMLAAFLLAAAARCGKIAAALIELPLQAVKATPVASFIILALLWVSSKWLSVLISFLMALPVLYSAVQTGLDAADPALLEMARVFRIGPWGRIKAIWLPGLLPAFRRGCAVALGICWKSGIAAEVIGLPNGSIGDALYRAKITLSTAEVFAWTIAIVALSMLFERLFLELLAAAEASITGAEKEGPCSQ